jgi:hypothetical protein
MSESPSAVSHTSRRSRRIVVGLELLVVAVLAGAVCWNGRDILRAARKMSNDDSPAGQRSALPDPSGDKAAEKQAVAELNKRQFFVNTEPPDHRATSINFCGRPLDDGSLDLVSKLYRLRILMASDTHITDAQLKCLSGLSVLTTLDLQNTPINGDGLAQLRPLVHIEALYLNGTQVSDRTLDILTAFPHLRILDLSRTKVTDKGLKKLLPMAELQHLLLSETRITNDGMKDVAALKSLNRLTILKTPVTASGAARVKKAHPKARIDRSPFVGS